MLAINKVDRRGYHQVCIWSLVVWFQRSGVALKTAIDFYSHFSSLWRNLTLSLPAKKVFAGGRDLGGDECFVMLA